MVLLAAIIRRALNSAYDAIAGPTVIELEIHPARTAIIDDLHEQYVLARTQVECHPLLVGCHAPPNILIDDNRSVEPNTNGVVTSE